MNDLLSDREHAMIIRFRRNSDQITQLFDLELELALTLAKSGVGRYNGHELNADRSSGHLYISGPDADEMLMAVRPILEKADGIDQVVALLRHGPASPHAARSSFEIRSRQVAK